MKLLIFLFFFLFTGFLSGLYAQDPDPVLQQRLMGKTTLKTIMKEVDDYYQSKGLPQNKANGEGMDNEYVKWKRWEWYMRDRLGPNREFVDINQKMKEASALRDNRDAANPNLNSPNGINNVSSGSWSFLGPTSVGTVWGTLPGNGRVDRIAFHPTIANTIYAATPGGGFWKSTNGGTSWAILSNDLTTMGISGIVIDRVNPNIIYLLTGTGDGFGAGYFVYDFGYIRSSVGVLKSTDGGVSWTTTGDLYTGGTYVGYKLVQDPRNSAILLAATDQGLYRTTNAGSTWNQVMPGKFIDVEFNPVSSATSNSAYATGPGYYYYSNNEGANWIAGSFSVALHATGRNAIAVTSADTNKVYVLSGPTCSGGNPFWGIYRSANGGRSFTIGLRTPNILGSADLGSDCVNQTDYDLGIAAAYNNANFIAMCCVTIWTSIDQGISSLTHCAYYWGGPTNDVHPDVHAVEYNPLDDKLYACTDGGLYVSLDNGNHWTFISDGLNSSQWYHFTGFANDPSHLTGGLQDNGIRNRTTYTTAFNHVTSGDGFDCAYDPNNSSRFYSIINSGGSLFTANGATNASNYDFDNYFPKIGRHPSTTTTIYVGREDKLYQSTNEGSSFGSTTAVGGNRRIVFAPSLSTTIYVANSDKVWKNTTSGSGAWTDLSLSAGWPAGSPTVTCVAVNPANSNYLCVTFGGFTAGAKVLYSNSGGATWSNESNSLPNVPVNCAVMNIDNSIYIGTDDGVYYQSPSDVDWLPFYNFLPRVPVTDMMIFQTQGLIYASTFGRGLWFSSIKEACDVDLTLSGSIGGQFFNQASNSITTTQVLAGGEGTTVFNRSGNFVKWSPGFEVKKGNEYKAYIGPCDQHGVPIFAPNRNPGSMKTPDEVPDYILPYDSVKQTNLPYGYIEVKSTSTIDGKVSLLLVTIFNVYLPASFAWRETLQQVYTQTLTPGERSISFMHSQLEPGLYYIELWYGDKLAHFQEYRVF